MNEFCIAKFQLEKHNAYYIVIKIANDSHSDSAIASLLDMTLEEYCDLLLSYGAYNTEWFGYIFASVTEANKFKEYLNEKYLLSLKLQEKV